LATAKNIKSKQTRSAVTESLKGLLGCVEAYSHKGKILSNGLVMLSGGISVSDLTKIPCYV